MDLTCNHKTECRTIGVNANDLIKMPDKFITENLVGGIRFVVVFNGRIRTRRTASVFLAENVECLQIGCRAWSRVEICLTSCRKLDVMSTCRLNNIQSTELILMSRN